jgi:hypothetical protein
MSSGTIVIIIIAIIVVVAIVAGVAYEARRRRLRQRFGPEYDRLVEQGSSRRQAEAELAARERRVRDLDIRPLSAEAQARYAGEWTAVQERFVDAPQDAVAAAQRLVVTVMKERGYPTEDSDQVLADLSVEHARVLDHYRAAYGISQRAADGSASTEDLRQAMIHYRALFQDLLGAESAREQELVGTADTATVSEPTTISDTAAASEPTVDAEPVAIPEPAATAEPVNGSEPADVAEPTADDEPLADEEPLAEPVTTAPDLPRQRRV